ncbi:MAG: hypothetical protein AB7T06_14405 [Kofleriaceae bacterium]
MRALAILVVLAGCATADTVGPVRFANAPPVWRVNDRVHVAKPPAETPFLRALYHFDSFYLRAKRGFDLVRDRRALGVNAFDEVPDSTWFTNRIGVRDVSPDEIRRGPGSGESPDRHLPWTIENAKEGGTAIGFRVTDTRGVTFILKFDQLHAPEVETGADAVVARLLWAAGYNVPEDHVVYFTRKDLVIARDAYVKVDGVKRPIDAAYLDRQLAKVAIGRDGRIRGLASVLIDGVPLGGSPRLGVREDDPNDLIPHELRRDQRGQAPLFAWLSHTDIKEDNTFDAFQHDPADKRIDYVVHYLIDFGNALGTQSMVRRRPYPDYQYDVDLREWALSLLTLGLHRQPWEGRVDPEIPGVGMFSASHFDPGRWKPNTFAQLPIIYADRFDQFWGAKLAIRFTRAQLAAAVDAGRYSDPRAARYLVDTLVARQRIVAAYWFARTNPIDDVRVQGSRVCFTDLALRHGLLRTPTTFTVRAFDGYGKPLDFRRTIRPDARGEACVDDFALAPDGSRYTILAVENSRGMPGTLIHFALDPNSQQPRVIGLFRQ